MKPGRILLLVASVCVWFGLSAGNHTPNANAHSHNDYLRARPFMEAWDNNFGSIEADLFLVDGELYVAHTRREITPERTFDALYLAPLLGRIEAGGGRVYPRGGKLQLLIDLKTSGETLRALEQKLRPVRHLFDTTANPDAVRLVISGGMPSPDEFASYDTIFFFDGRAANTYTPAQEQRVAFYSSPLSDFSRWDGGEAMPAAEMEKIAEFVESIHAKGKRVRFWGCPDTPLCWQTFADLGVDYLNTDRPADLAKFLNDVPRNSGLDGARINEIQVIGSHNSYRRAIEPALIEAMKEVYPSTAGLEYTHTDLADQLDQGLRNLEVDVYGDSEGGRYANPRGPELVDGLAPYNTDGVMNRPGFKVLHSPDYDFRVSAPTLQILLGQLRAWSDANPGHIPVFITLEAKDPVEPNPGRPGTELLTPESLDRLDAELRRGLGEEKLITPDMVRGDHPTLNSAATGGGWPTVAETAGRFLFIFDDRAAKRDMYMEGHPSLRGRVMFVNAVPGTPESAALIRNNPADETIPGLVRQGYLIRTRADSDTRQARANDTSDMNAAFASGAQIVTTDYYKKSEFFDSPYVVVFPGGGYVRPNPVNSTGD
jgi:hypothetical protein